MAPSSFKSPWKTDFLKIIFSFTKSSKNYPRNSMSISNIVCQAKERLYYYLTGNFMARLKEIFAYNLKAKRRKCGFTQAQLAERVEVSTHHIGMLEIARNYPTLELVERIADVLDTEIYELFIDPLSPHEELKRLYQTIANDIEQLVAATIEKALSGKCAD
jgi:transcriptional regulator with XRE-family HTH domain